MSMPQRPTGLDMKLSKPNKLSRPKLFNENMIYFCGGSFPRGFIFFLSELGFYFLDPILRNKPFSADVIILWKSLTKNIQVEIDSELRVKIYLRLSRVVVVVAAAGGGVE